MMQSCWCKHNLDNLIYKRTRPGVVLAHDFWAGFFVGCFNLGDVMRKLWYWTQLSFAWVLVAVCSALLGPKRSAELDERDKDRRLAINPKTGKSKVFYPDELPDGWRWF